MYRALRAGAPLSAVLASLVAPGAPANASPLLVHHPAARCRTTSIVPLPSKSTCNTAKKILTQW